MGELMSILKELQERLHNIQFPIIEEIWVSIKPNNDKSPEFTKDIVAAVKDVSFNYSDEEGLTHSDGHIILKGYKSSSPLTKTQEMNGWKRDNVLVMNIPKGSSENAVKAINGVLSVVGFVAERVFYRAPGVILPPDYLGGTCKPQINIGAKYDNLYPTGRTF